MAASGEFPRRLGSYVLLEPLARGGMGALYLAVIGDRGMEKLCVIKTVLPHLMSAEYVQRFRDEAKVVVKLSHGNLVTVLDAGQVGGELYIALDFIEGKDLVATWNRCAAKGIAFPVDVAAHIVKELARGLGYAHAFGGLKLVHRDVSPGNVLLAYSGEVKLTDFGLAASALKREKTLPGVVYGKVSYMAPEQARHQPIDGRTDIYAAGIVLWELLTGRQLFPSKPAAHDPRKPAAPFDALERVRNPRVQPPSALTGRVPPDLDRIALKALAVDPADRYQAGEDLRADLAAHLARTAPATDADHVAKFLHRLFMEDMAGERAHRQALVAQAAELLSGPVALSGPASAGGTALSSGDPRVGTVLDGRYRLDRLIGEGGMGRVYEAEHVEIGKRMAVKVLARDGDLSSEALERFRREARAASKVNHPNIVHVTDVGTTPDGLPYIVMEYVEGAPLAVVIRRDGPMPLDRALPIALQVCKALQAAHDRGVVHRDLNAGNVLLTARPGRGAPDVVKVVDFGIAKSPEPEGAAARPGLTRPGALVGTPRYMAPEQAAGQPATLLADVYAAGEMLYEMLAGRPPYDGENLIEILRSKAQPPVAALRTLRPNVPSELERAVEKAMARRPEDRHQSMQALAQDLQACLAELGPAVPEGASRSQSSSRSVSSAAVAQTDPISGGRRPSAATARWPMAVGLGVGALTGVAVLWLWVGAAAAPPPPARDPRAGQVRETKLARRLSGAEIAVTPRKGAAAAAAPPARAEGGAGPERAAGSEPPDPVPERTSPATRRDPRPVPAAAVRASRTAGTAAAPPPDLRPSAVAPAAPVGVATASSPAVPLPAGGTGPTPAGRPAAGELLQAGEQAFQAGNYSEAGRRGRQALEAGAGVRAHLLLGDTLYKVQRYGEAVRQYQAALAIDPGNAHARRAADLAGRKADEGR